MKTLYAMLPCYNEEDNIGQLIEEWIKQGKTLSERGYDLVIVGIDDKSTDSTKNIIKKKCECYNNVRLIAHEVNKNLGGGVMSAFQYFVENASQGDLCTLMDGDNTHDPQYIMSMIDKIESGADCVIASRYCKDSNVIGVPGNRLFLSSGARWYYKLVLRVKNVEDYTCGYRTYTYDIIKKAFDVYGNHFVEKKTFACMMEVLYKLANIGCSFAEVPFELRYDNKGGESKMRIMKTVKDSLLTAIFLRLKNFGRA